MSCFPNVCTESVFRSVITLPWLPDVRSGIALWFVLCHTDRSFVYIISLPYSNHRLHVSNQLLKYSWFSSAHSLVKDPAAAAAAPYSVCW